MDGLSNSIKEGIREYTSTKDLWFKLESEYQRENQDIEKETEFKLTEYVRQEEKEVQASNISGGKDLSYYSSIDCDDIKNDLEDVKKDLLAHILKDIDLKYNLRLKKKILTSLENYHYKTIDLLKKLNHQRKVYKLRWKTNKMKLKD